MRGPRILLQRPLLREHLIQAVFIVLFTGLYDFHEAVAVMNSPAQSPLHAIFGVAPVIVVKIDVALVFLHEPFYEIRAIRARIVAPL